MDLFKEKKTSPEFSFWHWVTLYPFIHNGWVSFPLSRVYPYVFEGGGEAILLVSSESFDVITGTTMESPGNICAVVPPSVRDLGDFHSSQRVVVTPPCALLQLRSSWDFGIVRRLLRSRFVFSTCQLSGRVFIYLWRKVVFGSSDVFLLWGST